MTVYAINDYLIVELIKNSGSIVTADSGESIQRGRVTALPDKNKLTYFTGNGWIMPMKDMNISVPDVGEEVIFRKYADSDGSFQADGKSFAFIKLSDVMGYVEDKK